MHNVYSILDLKGYANAIREAAAESFSTNYSENLDEFITISQMINLVDELCLGYDSSDNPIVDEETNEEIFQQTQTWIQNSGLAKLAAEDTIECAWDSEYDCMVFWYPQKEKNKGSQCPHQNNK